MGLIGIPTVNFSQGMAAAQIAVEARQPVLLIGDPGVGKTALARALAEVVKRPLVTLLGSTIDPTDVGGIPAVIEKTVRRLPLEAIRACCDGPAILFLDELSCAPLPVQAALLRLFLERVAGDNVLHPDTYVIAAANPPEQAPGGFEISAPLMGRVAALWLRPTEDEVLNYFLDMGEEGSPLRQEAQDFALTAKFSGDLLQIDIPNGCASGQRPWAAPRAWERAVRIRAAAGKLLDNPATHALVAGSVGADAATAYRALLDLRKKVPSVEDIANAPEKSAVPDDLQLQLAALGLIPRVANINTWSAWIYASRLRPEYAAACARTLLQKKDSPVTAPHAKAGMKARIAMAPLCQMGGLN